MIYRKTLTAMVAASIVLGSAASAATDLRQPAAVGDSEQIGGAFGWIIALAVAAGVALVIINDDKDDPVSP